MSDHNVNVVRGVSPVCECGAWCVTCLWMWCLVCHLSVDVVLGVSPVCGCGAWCVTCLWMCVKMGVVCGCVCQFVCVGLYMLD
jgi:predicted membrane metal-binding protein